MTDRDAAAPEGVGVTDLPEVSMHTVTEPTIGRQLLTARRRAWIAALLGAALLAPAGAAHAAAHDTTLVSRASGPAGASANAGSIAPPAVSADGRFVAFWSNATNLSPDDSDALYDLYRRDVASDTTVLVSRASGKFGPKAAATFDFGGPSMSGDGRLVAFMADAANLSPDDKDALGDIYVRDLDSHETILVSRASGADGVKANEASLSPDDLGRRPVRGVRLGGDEPDRGSADRRAGVRPRPGDEHDHARVARDGSRRRARRPRRQFPGDLGRRPVRRVHHAQRAWTRPTATVSSTSTSATGGQRRPRSCRAPRASSAPSLARTRAPRRSRRTAARSRSSPARS